ncbi:MAG: hypothetical protein ABJG41_20510 [Cyclobacteriaceae bacterium]
MHSDVKLTGHPEPVKGHLSDFFRVRRADHCQVPEIRSSGFASMAGETACGSEIGVTRFLRAQEWW